MIETIVNKIKQNRTVLSRFSVVGVSGIVVNQGLLTLLTEVYGMRVGYAGIIAIEVSIITNFLLNNFWTWNKGFTNGFIKRLTKYHMVTLVSGGINYIVLIFLTRMGIHHLISNLIGIGAGFVLNFLFNHMWTFNEKKSPDS